MIDFQFAVKEVQRNILMRFARILSDEGYEAGMSADEAGCWELRVKVPAPSGFPASFSLKDLGGNAMTLSAYYISPLVETGLFRNWTITVKDDPEEICRELISYFVIDCADREYEAVLVPTMINDENLQYFVPLLSDKILTVENEYAVGVFARDEGGLEVAAAAGFAIAGDRLIIEDIAVRPDYDDLGIKDYLVRYIQKMIIDSGAI